MILIPILGDQLTHRLASLVGVDKADARLLLMEVTEETTYVRHHKAKIVLILSAMRHFADELRAEGWQVDYIHLDDPENSGSFTGEVARAVERHRPSGIRIVEAGEWRVQKAIEAWSATFGLPVEILSDDRFICPLPDFFAWAADQLPALLPNQSRKRSTGPSRWRQGFDPERILRSPDASYGFAPIKADEVTAFEASGELFFQ